MGLKIFKITRAYKRLQELLHADLFNVFALFLWSRDIEFGQFSHAILSFV